MNQADFMEAIRKKRNTLVLLSFVGLFILILAMSLSSLALAPGQPFSLGQAQESFGLPGGVSGTDLLVRFFQGIVAIGLIIFFVHIVYSLLTPEGRKRLATEVVLLVILFLLANFLHSLAPAESATQRAQMLNAMNLPGKSALPTTIFPAEPPTWLVPLIVFLVAIVLVGVVLLVAHLLRRPKDSPEFSLDQLVQGVQQAIDSLHAGADFRATVISCYREMVRVVKVQQGIAREATMTTREFEERLISKGLPQTPVRTLTRLFEQARYGGFATDTGQEDVALSCLTDIVNACKAIGNRRESH